MFFTEDVNLYLVAARDSAARRYLEISVGMMLFWDWAILLDDEVELIWKWDWSSLGKPTYLALRYGGAVVHMFDAISTMGVWERKYCKVYLHFVPPITTVFIYLVDVVLAYRAACLYPNQFLRLSTINTVLLSCSVVATMVLAFFPVTRMRTIDTPMYLTGCWRTDMTFNFGVIGPPIAFELWILALVVYKLYVVRTESNLKSARSMFNLVASDQIYWFFLVTAAIIWSAVQLMLARPTLRNIPFMYLRSLACICGCHLILHIRQSYNSRTEHDEVTFASVLFRKPATTNESCTVAENGTHSVPPTYADGMPLNDRIIQEGEEGGGVVELRGV